MRKYKRVMKTEGTVAKGALLDSKICRSYICRFFLKPRAYMVVWTEFDFKWAPKL